MQPLYIYIYIYIYICIYVFSTMFMHNIYKGIITPCSSKETWQLVLARTTLFVIYKQEPSEITLLNLACWLLANPLKTASLKNTKVPPSLSNDDEHKETPKQLKWVLTRLLSAPLLKV